MSNTEKMKANAIKLAKQIAKELMAEQAKLFQDEMKKMQDEMSKMKEELSKKVEDAISGKNEVTKDNANVFKHGIWLWTTHQRSISTFSFRQP